MPYPCSSCNRDEGSPICLGDERCQRGPAPQRVPDGVARLKVKLIAEPDFAKALLPNLTHEQVKAALRPRPA